MPAAASTISKKSSVAAAGPTLKSLQTKLKETQSQFSDIWEFVADFKDSTTFSQIQVRLDKLDELWERFSDTIVEVKSHDDYVEEGDSYAKERQEFSNRYYEAKAFLIDKTRELQEPTSLDQSVRGNESMIHATLDHVRLPQIKLQTFNGDIDEWLSFRDLYLSLIHCKTDLPEVEKFHYLKGCLQGEPKSLIDALQITKANYQIAWDMLLKRYNNSKQLKKRQIQSFFNLPSVSKESVSDLHSLVEGFERIIQTLDQVIQPAEYKDLLLVNIITARLDPVTRRGWEEYSSTKEQDTLTDLMDFLQRRIRILESLPIRTNDNKVGQQSVPKQKHPTIRTSYSTVQEPGGKCMACTESHYLHTCPVYLKFSVSDREALLRKHSLCRNCFRSGHHARDCRSKYSCRNCKGRHHTLVCFKSEKANNATVANVTDYTSKDNAGTSSSTLSHVANTAVTDVQVSGSAQQHPSQVLLATAVVLIEDGEGNKVPARALLDSGSESNFISERLCQLLKVTRDKVEITVQGIGQASTQVKHKIRVTVRSRVTGFSQITNFLVLPRVTVNLPTTSINTRGWRIPKWISLADPTFFESNRVDIVLGIESFFNYFNAGRKYPLGKDLPTLIESVFGWVACGGISVPGPSVHINCNMSVLERLDELVSRFWSSEEIGSSENYSPEEARCEAQFRRTVNRAADGRYTVSLPKDDDVLPRLGESRDIAVRRLQATERRLARDASLREQYTTFMEEYRLLGHMQKITEATTKSVKRCYLPHHPVVKESSTTTKVRVVFDASCKTSTGVSVNDALFVGPVIQEELRSIILRSRTRQIMIVSDVEKMFRQINVNPDDRPLQSILWRSSPAEEIGVYELNTVTYGTKPAPFLATRTLKQLAMDEEKRFPLAATAVSEDVYMDDVITGADVVEKAVELRTELNQMMESGGFRLRKWASNCTAVLDGIPEQNLAIQETDGINLEPDPSVTTLGLVWMPRSDVFKLKFEVPVLDVQEQLTKRKVLSVIASLFDPLGLIGATITTAKIFMQLLWTLEGADGKKLDWNQPLPSTVGEEWTRYYQKLPLLHDIRVDRCVFILDAVSVQLHCFSDASEKAYGTCVYVRSQDAEGRVIVRLLTSKSKVAPLKSQSIPRLELCGALLAAQLYQKVKDSLRIPVSCYFWTDSTCVLRWIQSVPNIWATYVANRVSKIQTLTEGCQWRHVPGVQNPADLISRGISPELIINNRFWWEGPSWLKDSSDEWPQQPVQLSEEGEEEKRRSVVCSTASPFTEFNELYISKHDSYSDLIRRTAYWMRLMDLLQKPKEEMSDTEFLSNAELTRAENTIIRRVQQESFAEEWKALSKGESVAVKSPLRWFNPYISRQDNLLRVGGRLANSDESEQTKHPVILPARHLLTRKLLQSYHKKLLHAGPQLLLATVRLRYWPLGGRSLARQIVHQCIRCFRSKPSTVKQFMGELPASRVRISRPFSKTGVDYFGPVYVRPGPRRAAVKAYVAIFVCLCTKAVHMELVTDLSTERFLMALRRFIARRGKCTDIYSDNGTNFVGARNQMEQFLRLLKTKDHAEKVTKECSKEGITWHFSPPSGPHFGGLWEAAVRSAKLHLLRVLGETVLPYEDMTTLLTQIEGCLNSRPLTPMSDDPNDLEPLTPAHFLIGSSLEAHPEPDFSTVQMNRLEQWQTIQQNLQHFWKRWKTEYLSQLQGRAKRWRPAVQIEIGKLVVIKDDNQPPMRWKMGRIVKLHSGADGVIRVVTLKTASGPLTHPVEKICILPIQEPLRSNQQTDSVHAENTD